MRFSLSRAFDFAHLGGRLATAEETADDLRLINGQPSARADSGDEEDDDEGDDGRKQKDGESDDDYAKRMKKLDDDEAAAKKGKKKGDAEDDDESDDNKDDPKEEASARVRKAEARGARGMQQRIGKILSSPAAARNMKLAAKLACNTQMSADEAIVIVEESPAASGRLGDRMAGAPQTRVPLGGSADRNGPAAISASWDEAFKPYHAAK